MNNWIIKNVFLIDGSGNQGKSANLAIENGVIKFIGDEIPAGIQGDVFDGEGLALTPGFIDPHTHSDVLLMVVPEALSKISQGITTDLGGNCGSSYVPVTDKNRTHLQKRCDGYDLKITWSDFKSFVEEIQRRQPAVNYGLFCGHNSIRAAAVGYEKKKLDFTDIEEMRQMTRTALEQGAIGFTTGFLYIPGKFSDYDEVVSLLKVLQEFPDRVYATHMRSEGDKLIESIEENVSMVREAGLNALHISHFKVTMKNNWGKLDQALELIEKERAQGLKVTADRYPYLEGETSLAIILPDPCDAMPNSAIYEYLQNDANFAEISRQMKDHDNEYWGSIRLASTNLNEYKKFQGRTFDEIGKLAQKKPAVICMDILRGDAVHASACFKGMKEENMRRIIEQPWVCCGSDESARPLDESKGRSHPRGFGSFPKYINYLKGKIGLEKAIAKVTSLPANIFGLRDRGRIAPGMAADMVLLDPDQLEDTATYAEPHQLTKGINKVWVNGTLTYDEGEICESRNGKFLTYSRTR